MQLHGNDQLDDIGVDPKAERKLVRKLDTHIIPIIMLLYLLSFSTGEDPAQKVNLVSLADERGPVTV